MNSRYQTSTPKQSLLTMRGWTIDIRNAEIYRPALHTFHNKRNILTLIWLKREKQTIISKLTQQYAHA